MTREALLELQDYDLWANRRWFGALSGMPDPGIARQIFAHILVCQHKWLSVVISEEESGALSENLEEEMNRLYAAWREVLQHGDPNAYASMEREGVTYFHMVSEIAHHVFNHGTYHRGHLRGLADAVGFEEFPETDLIRWFRENQTG